MDGSIEAPDAVVVGDGRGFYDLMVNRTYLAAVVVEGDTRAVEEMLASLPQVRVPEPLAVATWRVRSRRAGRSCRESRSRLAPAAPYVESADIPSSHVEPRLSHASSADPFT